MPHIRLVRIIEERRTGTGRSPKPPARDQETHGERIRQQILSAVENHASLTAARPAELPPVPEGLQLALKATLSPTGKPLLTAHDIPSGWQVQVLDERRDGVMLALVPDPTADKISRAAQSYREDERTASGRRKGGTKAFLSLDQAPPVDRDDKMGPGLCELIEERGIENDAVYCVDIEVGAPSEDPDAVDRPLLFDAYLRAGAAEVISGPFLQTDYVLFRARLTGRLLVDVLDVHPWVSFVDTPPEVERQGLELLDVTEPELPKIVSANPNSPAVVVVDAGVLLQHPLITASISHQGHHCLLPDGHTADDGGACGHGTAIASIAALGDLRQAILDGRTDVGCRRIVVLRVLDDRGKLPEEVDLPAQLPGALAQIREITGGCIVNHSIATPRVFDRRRMSKEAEAIDITSYDDGQDGFLFVLPTGNLDGYSVPDGPTLKTWVELGRYPDYLLFDECRLRNPAQAINALTVGAYVPQASRVLDDERGWLQPLAPSGNPSPLTRSGPGYLDEIKPELVEEGGNWYCEDAGAMIDGVRATDVAVANHDYPRDGKLLRHACGSSCAVPRVSHLAAELMEEIQGASVDTVRALLVNSAEWPERLESTEATLRSLGYGVPNRQRALIAQGPRCIALIEDRVPIGSVHYYTLPFPADLFDADPSIIIRVSVTLAYRAPVRRSNLKYRGTILEWKMGKRDEDMSQLRSRCASHQRSADDEAEDDTPPGRWNWYVGPRLRTKGTVQKDWFEAPASSFGSELLLAVIGRRGWLTKEQEDAGFLQRYAAALSVEALGAAVPLPLHERIEAAVRVSVPVR